MIPETFFPLLDTLRFTNDMVSRKEALAQLIYLEESGELTELHMMKLFDDENEVIKDYSIAALGRNKVERGIPGLIDAYSQSDDPILLVSLLNAFCSYENPAFVDVVARKLLKLNKKGGFFGLGKRKVNPRYENTFVLDQILLPSLKYFQCCETAQADVVLSFLDYSDKNVRWHVLKVIEHADLEINIKQLEMISQTDEYVLVREQATIMIQKRSSHLFPK